MAANAKADKESGEPTSINEPEPEIEAVDYTLKIRCTKHRDGTKTCTIGDITVLDPSKVQAPEAPVASPQKDASVTAVPATPVAAAPRELTATGKDGECALCDALASALREKIESKAQAAPEAARKMSSSLGRRLGKA